MGVYINGMEMPKNCMLCPLCVEEADPANGEMCMVTGKLMPPCNRERLDDCPLVPVPPHGMLGDLDAISEKIKRDNLQSDPFVRVVCSYFDDAPTIIPAEPSEEQREYEAQVEAAQYCEMYEPTHDPETGAM